MSLTRLLENGEPSVEEDDGEEEAPLIPEPQESPTDQSPNEAIGREMSPVQPVEALAKSESQQDAQAFCLSVRT